MFHREGVGIGNLLNEYVGRGHYYYNVVTILDRALYTPKILRDSFLKEERQFFENLTPGMARHWQDL
jgi:hypothetical protein